MAWKSLGKHDTKGKHDSAALEKEGSENISLYTDKASNPPKHDTVYKISETSLTSMPTRIKVSSPSRCLEYCDLVQKSEQRNNNNITQNSVQTDLQGKTETVQKNKFRPHRTQKILSNSSTTPKSAKQKPLEDDKLRFAMKTWLGQKNPKQ